MTELNIPDVINAVGDYSFCNCSCITSVVIPDGVTSIGNYAFSGCSSIQNVSISESVTSIGNHAFEDCVSLASINIPDGVTTIGQYAMAHCEKIESVFIGNGVVAIGTLAFVGCTNLIDLTIGSNVSEINESAFKNCPNIERVYALNPKAITCDLSIFHNDVYNNATLYVPEGREQAYERTTPWYKFYIQTITAPAKSFDVTIGSAGYSTLYLDYAVERPRGVEVYYVSRVTDDHAVLKAVWDYIPANTGVILRGSAGTYTFASTTAQVNPISENMLRGTTVDTEIPAEPGTTYYALGRNNGVVGLYAGKIVNGYFFNNANKAYLPLKSEPEEDEDEQLVRGFFLIFPDSSTTVKTEIVDSNDAEVLYDLQGRCLTTITEHGIYIVNGKKVVR